MGMAMGVPGHRSFHGQNNRRKTSASASMVYRRAIPIEIFRVLMLGCEAACSYRAFDRNTMSQVRTWKSVAAAYFEGHHDVLRECCESERYERGFLADPELVR